MNTPNGYGTDPNLVRPYVPWPFTLTESQRKLVAVLSDIILPAGSGEFPAPSEMGIVDFFDEWVSAPYPQQQTDRELLASGFTLIELDSKRRFGSNFVSLMEDEKHAIVDELSGANGTNSISPGQAFFQRFRYLVVGGYFTSNLGFRAIGYIGNVPMQSYPSVSSEVLKIIEEELTLLGLPSESHLGKGGS